MYILTYRFGNLPAQRSKHNHSRNAYQQEQDAAQPRADAVKVRRFPFGVAFPAFRDIKKSLGFAAITSPTTTKYTYSMFFRFPAAFSPLDWDDLPDL